MKYGRPFRSTPMDRLVSKTLKEIADELGCTPQAVRHVEKRALKKLRAAFVEQRIVTKEGRYEQ